MKQTVKQSEYRRASADLVGYRTLAEIKSGPPTLPSAPHQPGMYLGRLKRSEMPSDRELAEAKRQAAKYLPNRRSCA